MYSGSLANLGRLVRILIGCVLVVWSLVSATAQSVGLEVRTATANSSDSQTNTQTIRDRSDDSKVIGSLTGANTGTATAPSPAIVESREFVREFVAEKLKLWQQNLKLGEWQISWSTAQRSDLKPHTVGQIHWDNPRKCWDNPRKCLDNPRKCAAILVLDPADYRMPFKAMLDDMELTIIHELVHLKLTSLPHSEAR